MKRLSKAIIEEYRYESEEEREKHVKEMEQAGYYCTGQCKRSDDSLHYNVEREYYWYGKFIKEFSNMGMCSNCGDTCGVNDNVEDRRCCFYCEYKTNCSGFCLVLEERGDTDEVALKCEYHENQDNQ